MKWCKKKRDGNQKEYKSELNDLYGTYYRFWIESPYVVLLQIGHWSILYVKIVIFGTNMDS